MIEGWTTAQSLKRNDARNAYIPSPLSGGVDRILGTAPTSTDPKRVEQRILCGSRNW